MDVPFWQTPRPSAAVAVRTQGPPAGVQPAIAAAIRTLDPEGAALGVVGAYFVAQAMRGMQPGVGGLSGTALAVVAALLLWSALMACLVPARRAAAVDPMVALRPE